MPYRLAAPRALGNSPPGLLWSGRGVSAMTGANANPNGSESNMKLMRFWNDLNIWNKFGLAFIAAVALILLILELT